MELSEELKNLIEKAAPLIIFFSLSTTQQSQVLPVLEKEEKYDFPDGDLWTSSTLEVLLCCYQAFINSISIRLILILDEVRDEDTESFSAGCTQISHRLNEILNRDADIIFSSENLDSVEWVALRQLSETVQEGLQIQLEIDTEMLREQMNYRLHP
jgi:hypothetical protein